MDLLLDIKGGITTVTSNYVCTFLNGALKDSTITLAINSNGGEVIETFSIVSAIMLAQERGAIIKTLCTGIADSCASWILAMGNKGYREVMPFASALLHPLQITDNEGTLTSIYDIEPTEENQQLFTISDQMNYLITQQTGLTAEALKGLFTANGGNGTTAKAEDLIKYGYADRIFKSSELKNTSIINIMNQETQRMNIYNSMLNINSKDLIITNEIIPKQKIDNIMDANVLSNVSRKLGLDSQSNEIEVLNYISSMKIEVDKLKNTANEKADLVTKYESERIDWLINTAIIQGKIKNTNEEIVKYKNKASAYRSVDFFAKEMEELPILKTKEFANLSSLGRNKYNSNKFGNMRNKEELLEVGNIDWKEYEEEEKEKNTNGETDHNGDNSRNDTVDKRKDIDEVGGILKSSGVSDEIIRTVIEKMEETSYDKDTKGDNTNEEDKKNISEDEALDIFENMNESEKDNLKRKNEHTFNKLIEKSNKRRSNKNIKDMENRGALINLLNIH